MAAVSDSLGTTKVTTPYPPWVRVGALALTWASAAPAPSGARAAHDGDGTQCRQRRSIHTKHDGFKAFQARSGCAPRLRARRAGRLQRRLRPFRRPRTPPAPVSNAVGPTHDPGDPRCRSSLGIPAGDEACEAATSTAPTSCASCAAITITTAVSARRPPRVRGTHRPDTAGCPGIRWVPAASSACAALRRRQDRDQP